ncbi:hypothetical protein NQ318_013040 [Aromia moschata]|uniref:GIY-YIG domain-containing protein n=1 Tax=Aromia moschata TaxID=1265417 RepID=A0AAV8Y6C3_9CUCU|nr:hypothetical protein NQ318_013040 [Aromia moschata]
MSLTLLGNPKDKINNNEKSGIYEISCKDCDQTYIGQTKRSILTRFKEHMAHLKYGRTEKSCVAQHAFDNNHMIDINNLKLIRNVTNSRQLDAFESLEIIKCNNSMNKDNGPIPTSPLFALINKDSYGSVNRGNKFGINSAISTQCYTISEYRQMRQTNDIQQPISRGKITSLRTLRAQKLGKICTEAYALLKEIHENECLSRTQVLAWLKWFKDGRETTEDDPRPGRPSTSRIDKHIEKIGKLICEGRRLSIRGFAEITGIDKECVRQILQESFNMRKVSAKWGQNYSLPSKRNQERTFALTY